jgi:hypothetical protein
MLEVSIMSVFILLICFALLSITIIVKKNGKFPQTHAGRNRGLQRKGIKCAQAQDFEARTQVNIFDRMSKEG